MQFCISHNIVTVILLAVSVLSTETTPGQSEFTGTTMGPIEYRVVIHDKTLQTVELETGIQDRLDQINQLMSTYIKSSDVSRFNNAQANQWIEVDALTLLVVKKSLEFSELTSGAFDITVGPAVNAWKFGPVANSEEIPDASKIEEIKEFVGYRNIEVRDEPPSIKKRNVQTEIDLSAIAKGFAVDRVAEFLAGEGLMNFMVEVGGEVFVRGKSDSGNWKIGIELPDDTKRSVSTIAQLTDQALATSGDYRNFRIIAGKRFSHTIDPVTCRPVENSVASCSVVAADCLTADAIATAVMVMGTEKGLQFCKDNGFQLSIIDRIHDSKERFATTSTDGFPIVAAPSPAKTTSNNKSIWPAFLGALVVFGLAVAGMAVGAIFNNRPISGSCGGIAGSKNDDGSTACTICEKPEADCSETVQDA